jgi:hypothetical protein
MNMMCGYQVDPAVYSKRPSSHHFEPMTSESSKELTAWRQPLPTTQCSKRLLFNLQPMVTTQLTTPITTNSYTLNCATIAPKGFMPTYRSTLKKVEDNTNVSAFLQMQEHVPMRIVSIVPFNKMSVKMSKKQEYE